MSTSKKTKFGKPRPRPKWLEAVRERLKRDFGKCTESKKKEWCFSCVSCRVGLSLEILDDAYGVGDRDVLKV